MKSSFWSISIFLAIVVCLAAPCFGQEIDPDPDSPTPVLLSQPTSPERLLAVPQARYKGVLPKTPEPFVSFDPQSVLTLFVTNVELMDNEGVNAFRVYVYQKSRKTLVFLYPHC